MRQFRTPGSARGAPGNRRPYLNRSDKIQHMTDRLSTKQASIILLVLFTATGLILVVIGMLAVSLIQEGIFHRLTAYDTAATDALSWEIKKNAFISNLPYGVGWVLLTGLCFYLAFRNARNLVGSHQSKTEQIGAQNP